VNNDFETKFYDNNGNPYKGIPVEDLLVKGVQVTAIIECAGVWFSGSKYGLTWRAKQFALPKSGNKISGFAFKGLKPQAQQGQQGHVEDGEEAEEAEEEAEEVDDAAAFRAPQRPSVVTAMMPPRPAAAATAMAAAAMVDDEEGDDVEPTPAPKRTIIKKKVIATKPK
jgi:hypothetical protein